MVTHDPGIARLRPTAWLLAAGSAILAVVMFLDWFSGGEVGDFRVSGQTLDFSTNDDGRTAWEAFAALDWLLAVVVLVGAGCVVLAVRATRGDLDRGAARVEAVLALLAVVSIAFRIASPPSAGLGPNVDVEPTAWAWVGLAACCLVAAAGGLASRN